MICFILKKMCICKWLHHSDTFQAANRHDLSFRPLHTHRVLNMSHSHDSGRTLMASESGIMAHEEDAQTK